MYVSVPSVGCIMKTYIYCLQVNTELGFDKK